MNLWFLQAVHEVIVLAQMKAFLQELGKVLSFFFLNADYTFSYSVLTDTSCIHIHT